ncbi:hypothetical protein ABVL33_002547 [Salmonella enterica]|nr:hypothetical protein [Salmonella enterica]
MTTRRVEKSKRRIPVIGISPFDVMHLDLTGLVGTDRTYGAVAQLSVTF